MKNSNIQKLALLGLGVGVVLVASYFVFNGKENGGALDGGVVKTESVAEGERVVVAEGKYQDFSEEVFAEALTFGKRRVYFFSAAWCSTCRAAHQDFLKNAGQLPEGVAVFKIDYDSNKDLRKKFGIPYQHTFVEVDENGNKIQMWSGGAVDEMLEFMR